MFMKLIQLDMYRSVGTICFYYLVIHIVDYATVLVGEGYIKLFGLCSFFGESVGNRVDGERDGRQHLLVVGLAHNAHLCFLCRATSVGVFYNHIVCIINPTLQSTQFIFQTHWTCSYWGNGELPFFILLVIGIIALTQYIATICLWTSYIVIFIQFGNRTALTYAIALPVDFCYSDLVCIHIVCAAA